MQYLWADNKGPEEENQEHKVKEELEEDLIVKEEFMYFNVIISD